MRPSYVPLTLALALACTDDTTATTNGDGGSESGSESTTTSTTETDTGDPDTGETDTGETGEPGPYCGDGHLDLGEECDDGNFEDGDGCSSECDSACGAQFWVDVSLDEGWFDIQAMRARAQGRLVLAGDVEIDGEVGRLRSVIIADTLVESAQVSAPLGPAGTVDLPQTHQVDAVAITDSGDLLAIGTSTEVMMVDQPPVTSYWLARFAGDDLSELWRVDIPAAEPEYRPLDIAALAGGDAVITMTIEVADNDRDIQVQRRSAVDGSEVWTSTHSGGFNGGWSLDEAGRVAVGGGDRVWAAGIVRVDWQTFETTILELNPDDGSLVWVNVPLPDPGNAHEQRIWDLAAGPNGEVAIGINVMGVATAYHFGAAFLYVDQQLAWSLDPDDLPWEDGDPHVSPMVTVDADGDVLVIGSYTHDFGPATAARPWVVEMAPDGSQRCYARVGLNDDAGIVPDIGYYDGGRGALNLDTYGPGGMGPGSAGNWIVGLRGWQ